MVGAESKGKGERERPSEEKITSYPNKVEASKPHADFVSDKDRIKFAKEKSSRLFDLILRSSSDGGHVLNQEVRHRVAESFDDISSFIDDVYGFLNSSHSLFVRNSCIDLIEDWRYFLHANGFRLPNHIYNPFDNTEDRTSSDQDSPAYFLSTQAGLANNGRLITGTAIKDSQHKTVPVLTERRIKEAKTGKYITRRKKFLVHDEFNLVSSGARVVAVECAPISRRKHFRLLFAET